MRNEEKQYVWHDGIRINDVQLVTLAMNAGSYNMAEHYLLSLLAHGVMHHLYPHPRTTMLRTLSL